MVDYIPAGHVEISGRGRRSGSTCLYPARCTYGVSALCRTGLSFYYLLVHMTRWKITEGLDQRVDSLRVGVVRENRRELRKGWGGRSAVQKVYSMKARTHSILLP